MVQKPIVSFYLPTVRRPHPQGHEIPGPKKPLQVESFLSFGAHTEMHKPSRPPMGSFLRLPSSGQIQHRCLKAAALRLRPEAWSSVAHAVRSGRGAWVEGCRNTPPSRSRGFSTEPGAGRGELPCGGPFRQVGLASDR